jgi:hypothetical protein
MFNSLKKIDKSKQAEDLRTKEVVGDFVTHNMPSSHLFSGQTFTDDKVVKKNITNPVNNAAPHHKVGLLIIFGGIILIISILYVGYTLLIKPAVKPKKELVENKSQVIEKIATATAPEIVSPIVDLTPTEAVVIATTSLEIATSSNEAALPEETPIFELNTEISTADTDADGLTDNEEKIIGSDPNKADTDDDGYLDFAEIKSGYDPLSAGKKISDDSSILSYKINVSASTIYPSSWEVTRVDSSETIIFADTDKAFIQVDVQENANKLKPLAWLEQEFPGTLPGDSISGSSWQGFYTQDGLAAYIFNQDYSKVYSFSCSPLTSDTSSIVLFRLMINNLTIK